MSRRIARTLTTVLVLLAFPSLAHAAPVPEGAEWTEATIPSANGVQLHADVLRPKHLPADARTPVILSIGPYFNHAGQVGAAGPIQDAPYDPVSAPTGPSDRFHDLIEGGRLMERGYTFVMVDLRGFGGSTGCLDWSGPGEQADVKAAVEWAAGASFSNGNVGMYGKSYDGVTGLIGAALAPKGLKAVVSQEPVYDMSRYLYSNGVRYPNSVGTPALYGVIASTPGPLLGKPDYSVASLNDLQRPGCPVLNVLDQQNEDTSSAYWRERNFIEKTRGSKVPVFLTQGFLENNTKPDGAFETYDGLAGPKRAWFGMWDHVRGNDVDADGRLLMGRPGWFDEVMRWYDHFLKGAPAPSDPPVVVQTSDGTYRAEQAWPPADAVALTSTLRPGSYTDDASNSGTGEGSGNGIWTISKPLAHDAWFAGEPELTADVKTLLPRANLVANVYDIAPDGRATMISRATKRIDASGEHRLKLLGNDWKLPAGHRVGVLLSSSNSEWWLHLPTLQPVTVASATIDLPFLTRARTQTIAGASAVKLDAYKAEAPFAVDAATIAGAESDEIVLPGPLTSDPARSGAPSPQAAAASSTATPAAAKATKKKAARRQAVKKLAVQAVRRGGRLVVTGKAPSGRRLVVQLRRGGKTVLTRRVTARRGAFRVTLSAPRRASKYTITITGTGVAGSRTIR